MRGTSDSLDLGLASKLGQGRGSLVGPGVSSVGSEALLGETMQRCRRMACCRMKAPTGGQQGQRECCLQLLTRTPVKNRLGRRDCCVRYGYGKELSGYFCMWFSRENYGHEDDCVVRLQQNLEPALGTVTMTEGMSNLNVSFSVEFVQCLLICKMPPASSSLPTPLHWTGHRCRIPVDSVHLTLVWGRELLGGSYKKWWMCLTRSCPWETRARRYWKMSWWPGWTSAQGRGNSPSFHSTWGQTWEKSRGAKTCLYWALPPLKCVQSDCLWIEMDRKSLSDFNQKLNFKSPKYPPGQLQIIYRWFSPGLY